MIKVIDKLDSFFWTKDTTYNLSIFRIVFSILLFVFYLERQINFNIYYIKSTYFSFEYFGLVNLFDFFDFIFTPYFHLVFLLLIIFYGLGWGGVKLLRIIFIINIFFIHGSFLYVTGIDRIVCRALFCLCFIVTNEHLVLELSKRPKLISKNIQYFTPIHNSFVFLMKLSLSVIYFNAGFAKFNNEIWYTGDALLHFSKSLNLPILPYFILYIGNYAVIIGETLGAFALWSRYKKHVVLCFIIFHLLIIPVIHLYFLSSFCIAILFLFLDPEYVQSHFSKLLRRMALRFP